MHLMKKKKKRPGQPFRKKLLSDRISLNISGEIYETRIRTLERFPHTLLGNQEKRLFYYCASSKQYFFERSRLFFDSILFFYQSNGILQCPEQIPVDLFEEECRFFQMPEDAIDKLRPKDDIFAVDEPEEISEEVVTLSGKIWNLFQNPESSTGAKYFAVFSLAMITISVIASCLETMPSLKSDTPSDLTVDVWSQMELTLNSWFLFELTVSAICSPNKKDFFTDMMTWFDIIAVCPYFIVLATSASGSSLSFLRIARLVRVGRLLRLSKHSVRLKIVVNVVKSSTEEFKGLLMCIMIVVVFGGSIIYYIESKQVGGGYTDIPMGMYWGIQSITTVGYGDIHPVTPGGKLFAAAFMTFGAVTLTIPVLTIITKFVAAYDKIS